MGRTAKLRNFLLNCKQEKRFLLDPRVDGYVTGLESKFVAIYRFNLCIFDAKSCRRIQVLQNPDCAIKFFIIFYSSFYYLDEEHENM